MIIYYASPAVTVPQDLLLLKGRAKVGFIIRNILDWHSFSA
jgi:hypothetical protein